MSQIPHFLAISRREKYENLKALFLLGLVLLGFKKEKTSIANTFFDLRDLPRFSQELRRLTRFDPKMAKMLLDPKHKGNRAWEYGLLLSHVSLKPGLRVLDVGSGGSALPFYLTQQGLDVIAFDLKTPIERPNDNLLSSYGNTIYQYGSVLKLPFRNNYFDLVLCLSTIEHLDYDPSTRRVFPYHLFLKRIRRALSEIVRVLKPNGRLFLTSDAYLPEFQKNDRYSLSPLYHGKIGAAFRIEDFEDTFIHTLTDIGCSLIGQAQFNFDDLRRHIDRSNYRGRYFTTFALYAQKT